jgi:hypothetical protein
MFPVISQETLDLIGNREETAAIHMEDFKLFQPHLHQHMLAVARSIKKRAEERAIKRKSDNQHDPIRDQLLAFWQGVLMTYEHLQRAYEIDKMDQTWDD